MGNDKHVLKPFHRFILLSLGAKQTLIPPSFPFSSRVSGNFSIFAWDRAINTNVTATQRYFHPPYWNASNLVYLGTRVNCHFTETRSINYPLLRITILVRDSQAACNLGWRMFRRSWKREGQVSYGFVSFEGSFVDVLLPACQLLSNNVRQRSYLQFEGSKRDCCTVLGLLE